MPAQNRQQNFIRMRTGFRGVISGTFSAVRKFTIFLESAAGYPVDIP